MDLEKYAKTLFAAKYNQIDKQIDEIQKRIEKLNDDIENNHAAIAAYTDAIEGYKSENNG